MKVCGKRKKFCDMRGSNSRPSDYETDALPTALISQAYIPTRHIGT